MQLCLAAAPEHKTCWFRATAPIHATSFRWVSVLSTTHCTSGFLSFLVTPLNMLSSQNPCIFFLPVCKQGLLHYCMCSLHPLAQLQPFATQDQCITLKESSWPLAHCWWVASCTSCSISAGSWGCRRSRGPAAIIIFEQKISTCTFLVMWKVKKPIINLCFLLTFVIWAVHIGICASTYPFRPLARLSTLWQSGIPPAQPEPAQPTIYINSRSSTKRFLIVL